MSRQEVADAVNHYLARKGYNEADIDANYVGKLERGEHRWPRDTRREAFRAALGAASDAALGFYIVRGEPQEAVDDVPNEAGRMEAADIDRRSLLGGIAGLVAALGLFNRGPNAEKAARVGGSDVARLNAIVALYRSVDYESGGGVLRVEAGRFAEAASSLSDRSCSDSVKPALLAAIANARQLAGWAAFDTGHHSDAQRHWLSAERTAVAAGDLRLAARVRYCQARQFQHLRHNGDALDTLRLAREHLARRATPAISAMLYGAEAASLAARGHQQEALAALGAATDAFDRIDSDREPEWMRFYDRGELLAQYGRVYRDLARADQRHGKSAVRWVTEAISAFGPQNVRSTVLNEVGLCSGLFLAGEPQEAITVGVRVIKHAHQLNSQRVHDRIRNLRRDLVRYAVDDPDVAEFSHALTTIGSSA
ncbi:hypothetical protein ACPCHT_32075 [Nucisporomicrobium flavum]|uniref:hypothetical protein n=1 Tax=Nucisporomicrobium flavum TaxID=2785915 RepID=UPI003C30BC17